MKTITKCRICKSPKLKQVINLGDFALTGHFPSEPKINIKKYPLTLVQCKGKCGLVQLKHSYPRNILFGDHYGYRSSLNNSMVQHLHSIVHYIKDNLVLKPNDVVVDIGSNDATLLKAYPTYLIKIGIDPAHKFKKYYKGIKFINDYFRKGLVKKKAKVITSIAMFYDLENPIKFMEDVYDSLSDDGYWITEQSYLPFMLKNTSYDTICHEHQAYYSLKQMKFLADKVGFKIIDVQFNDTNGGSFMVVMAKWNNYKYNSCYSNMVKLNEKMKAENIECALVDFKENVESSRKQLKAFLSDDAIFYSNVWGYGASTKGNVILQYCELNSHLITSIIEVNEEKFGHYTPGTNIPIRDSNYKIRPDYMLVLPWHFKEAIIKKEQKFLQSGGRLIFPLPKLEVVSNG